MITKLILLAIQFLALFGIWWLIDYALGKIPGMPGAAHIIWVIICCLIGVLLLLPFLGVNLNVL